MVKMPKLKLSKSLTPWDVDFKYIRGGSKLKADKRSRTRMSVLIRLY